MLVLDAVRDLRHVPLRDALLVSLTLASAGDWRASRAAARWHARWVLERGESLDRSRAMLAALAVLPDTDALERVLRSAGDAEALRELEWWHSR